MQATELSLVITRLTFGASALALLCFAAAARAQPNALSFYHLPARDHSTAALRAATFEVALQLPDGRWLARQLIELGVSDLDAGEAAKLAVGHLGQDSGGCTAKVVISQPVGGDSLQLDRLTLVTATDQTVLERRNGILSLVDSAQRFSRRSRIA